MKRLILIAIFITLSLNSNSSISDIDIEKAAKEAELAVERALKNLKYQELKLIQVTKNKDNVLIKREEKEIKKLEKLKKNTNQ